MKSMLKSKKLLGVIVLIVAAILSMTVFSHIASSPKTYAETIRVLEEQKQDALALNVAATATAATLSMLPDDTASPIAAELADMSTPLFAIVAVLYAEKFLLTTFGWIAFSFLIPIACVLWIIYIFYSHPALMDWVKRLFVLSLALIAVIPFGAKITAHIENTFAESVIQTYGAALSITEETTEVDEEEGNFFTEIFEDVTNSVVGLVDMAKKVLSTMVDAVAVLMITSCVIPILTAAAFVFLVKAVVKVDGTSGKIKGEGKISMIKMVESGEKDE